jgi:hypothetical protein
MVKRLDQRVSGMGVGSLYAVMILLVNSSMLRSEARIDKFTPGTGGVKLQKCFGVETVVFGACLSKAMTHLEECIAAEGFALSYHHLAPG